MYSYCFFFCVLRCSFSLPILFYFLFSEWLLHIFTAYMHISSIAFQWITKKRLCFRTTIFEYLHSIKMHYPHAWRNVKKKEIKKEIKSFWKVYWCSLILITTLTCNLITVIVLVILRIHECAQATAWMRFLFLLLLHYLIIFSRVMNLYLMCFVYSEARAIFIQTRWKDAMKI